MPDINEIIKNCESIFGKESFGHSEFQIRNFIIGVQPTNYGKYKQCVLELRSRIKNHKNITSKINEMKDKNDLESVNKVSEMEILLEDIEKEIYIFNEILNEIMPTIDLSKKDDLEKEYWDAKFNKEVVSHLYASTLQIPANIITTVLSLPDDSVTKNQVFKMINNIHNAKLGESSDKKNLIQ